MGPITIGTGISGMAGRVVVADFAVIAVEAGEVVEDGGTDLFVGVAGVALTDTDGVLVVVLGVVVGAAVTTGIAATCECILQLDCVRAA